MNYNSDNNAPGGGQNGARLNGRPLQQSAQNPRPQQGGQTAAGGSRSGGSPPGGQQNRLNQLNQTRRGGQAFGYNPYADGQNDPNTRQTQGQRNASGRQPGQNVRNNPAGQNTYTPAGQTTQTRAQFRKSTRKTDRNRMIILAIIAILLVTVVIVAVSAMNYRPGQSIDVPWGVVDGEQYHETTTDDGRPRRINAGAVPATYTRTNSSKYNFLVVGKDHVAYNTDVIWLVSFDVDSGSAAVLQIPRDTMIRQGGRDRRINTMYSIHYNEAVKNNRSGESDDWIQSGMEGLVSDIERNMCVNIDYWVLVNLEGFGQVVDALGGVEIDVPYDLDYEDPYQDLEIHIQAGPQVMDGETAQGYMRFRSGYVQGDIGRVSAQKIMITALLKNFREKFNLFMITDLAKVVFQNVKTSMQFADIGYLGRKALGVDLGSMVMMTLPGEATQARSGAWYYIMKRADTLYLVNRYFNVYDQPVSDSDFDRNQLFNDGASQKVMNIYLTPQADDPVAKYVTSGQYVDENSISIDLVPETTVEDDLSSTSGPDGGEDEE